MFLTNAFRGGFPSKTSNCKCEKMHIEIMKTKLWWIFKTANWNLENAAFVRNLQKLQGEILKNTAFVRNIFEQHASCCCGNEPSC